MSLDTNQHWVDPPNRNNLLRFGGSTVAFKRDGVSTHAAILVSENDADIAAAKLKCAISNDYLFVR